MRDEMNVDKPTERENTTDERVSKMIEWGGMA